MSNAEFDVFADEYHAQHRANVAISGEEPSYFAEYKIKVLREKLRAGGPVERLIDFGAGVGNSTPFLRRYLPATRLVSADVSRKSLDIAEARFPRESQTLLIEGRSIPAEDNTFDVAFSACVFHHIAHEEHVHWLQELNRVTRRGGTLMIFEHNPLNPLTVHAVNTCPFDANARLIRAGDFAARFSQAGWQDTRISYHLFFPHLLAVLRPLEKHLSHLPLGAQYAVMAKKSA